MKVGIVLYPTYGGSGVVATELEKHLRRKDMKSILLLIHSLLDWVHFGRTSSTMKYP